MSDREYHELAGSDLGEFVEAVKDTLAMWLHWHTDKDVWYDNMTAGGDAAWMYKEHRKQVQKTRASRKYLGRDPGPRDVMLDIGDQQFNWTEAACRVAAVDELSAGMRQCPECGAMWDSGDPWCECEVEDGEEIVPDLDNVIEWIRDIEYSFSEHQLRRALYEDGWEMWRDRWGTEVDSVHDEIKEALDRYYDLETNWDRLTWAREATRIYHVNGEVLSDYGDQVGLDCALVCEVRDRGFASVFGEDHVRAYLEEDEEGVDIAA